MIRAVRHNESRSGGRERPQAAVAIAKLTGHPKRQTSARRAVSGFLIHHIMRITYTTSDCSSRRWWLAPLTAASSQREIGTAAASVGK